MKHRSRRGTRLASALIVASVVALVLVVAPAPLPASASACIDIPIVGGPEPTAMTPDGRYLAYTSALGVDPLAVGGHDQVYVFDRYEGSHGLVSINGGETAAGNGDSVVLDISDDGNWVLFYTDAVNLGGGHQLVVRDRAAGTTEVVSVADDESAVADTGASFGLISSDGERIAFASTATNLTTDAVLPFTQIFVRDLGADTTELVTIAAGGGAGNGNSTLVDLTEDGTQVLFDTRATNLVATDANVCRDVYVRDAVSDTTELISVSSDGLSGGAGGDSRATDITGDGDRVLFNSAATNLDAFGVRNAYVRDRSADTTTTIGVDRTGGAPDDVVTGAEISPDGNQVSFASAASDLHLGATNGIDQIFVRTLSANTTALMSVRGSGFAANEVSSPVALRGGRVYFRSDATNLFDSLVPAPQVYVAPIPTGSIITSSGATLVSRDGTNGNVCDSGCNEAYPTAVSADGRSLYFVGDATNLTALTPPMPSGDSVYFHHLQYSFPDVPVAHPFWGQISWMAEYEITGGFPDGTFRPGGSVSRQAMAAFMQRLFVETGGTIEDFPDPGFSDVPETNPFHDEISWMAGTGITEGFPDGTFRPNASVSRQAMAAFMQRLFEETGGTIEEFPDPAFSDVPLSHQFYNEIRWMAGTGVTGGFPDGTFRPNTLVSRQAMAAFMFRLWEYMG